MDALHLDLIVEMTRSVLEANNREPTPVLADPTLLSLREFVQVSVKQLHIMK